MVTKSLFKVRNPFAFNSIDLNQENEFIELPNEESMQRKFSDLSKDMTPTYPDAFGISENNITNLFGKNQLKKKKFSLGFVWVCLRKIFGKLSGKDSRNYKTLRSSRFSWRRTKKM